MGSTAAGRRAELVARVEGHADPEVREAARLLLREIAMLRALVDDDGPPTLTLSRRRLVWRIAAVVLVVVGVGLAVVMAQRDENVAEFRRGLRDGYRAGMRAAPESGAVAVDAEIAAIQQARTRSPRRDR